MPRKTILPNADETFMYSTNAGLLPWQVIGSPDAADRLGISVQSLWVYKLRRQGPEPEPEAEVRKLYRGPIGHRTLYMLSSLLSWLPGGEIAADRPWHWSREWLRCQGREVDDDPAAVVAAIGALEADPRFARRRFGFKNPAKGLEHLRRCYGC